MIEAVYSARGDARVIAQQASPAVQQMLERGIAQARRNVNEQLRREARDDCARGEWSAAGPSAGRETSTPPALISETAPPIRAQRQS